MSTHTMEINYNNYMPDNETQPTTTGSETKGINLFRQGFPLSKTVKSNDTQNIMNETKIISILSKVIKTTYTTPSPAIVLNTPIVRLLPDGNNNEFSPLIGELVQVTNNPNTYVLAPGYGIVFKSVQGSSSDSYVSYYCYVKELLADGETNLWSIYITNEHRAPLIFDVQDDRDVIFTTQEDGTSYSIKCIDTTNFLIKSTSGGYETSVELKNTSFNLASDEKSENKATIVPFLCFKYNDATSNE